MKILIVAMGCNPSDAGSSLTTYGRALAASKIADVSVLSTFDKKDPDIPGVKFYHRSLPESYLSKLKRAINFYRTDSLPLDLDVRPDIVQIENLDLYNLARQFPGAAVVINEHNVWWMLEEFNIGQRPTLRHLPIKGPLFRWLVGRARRYELRALDESSLILVCSRVDGEAISKASPRLADKIRYIPHCLDIDRYEAEADSGDVILFMGSLIYYPNTDAARLICDEIAPRVDAQFHILGRGSVDIDAPPNVKFLGFAEDIRPHIKRARVCIAPLRHGSGSRLKILEYMAMGKPTVSTAKGAEGLEVTPGDDIIIEDDMRPFAGWLTRLMKDDGLCKDIGTSGRRLIEAKYDYRLYCDELKDCYERALGAPARGGAR